MHPCQILGVNICSLGYISILPRDIQKMIEQIFQYPRDLALLMREIIKYSIKSQRKYINVEMMMQDLYDLFMEYFGDSSLIGISGSDTDELNWCSPNFHNFIAQNYPDQIGENKPSENHQFLSILTLDFESETHKFSILSQRMIDEILVFKVGDFYGDNHRLYMTRNYLIDFMLNRLILYPEIKSKLLNGINPLTLEIMSKFFPLIGSSHKSALQGSHPTSNYISFSTMLCIDLTIRVDNPTLILFLNKAYSSTQKPQFTSRFGINVFEGNQSKDNTDQSMRDKIECIEEFSDTLITIEFLLRDPSLSDEIYLEQTIITDNDHLDDHPSFFDDSSTGCCRAFGELFREFSKKICRQLIGFFEDTMRLTEKQKSNIEKTVELILKRYCMEKLREKYSDVIF